MGTMIRHLQIRVSYNEGYTELESGALRIDLPDELGLGRQRELFAFLRTWMENERNSFEEQVKADMARIASEGQDVRP